MQARMPRPSGEDDAASPTVVLGVPSRRRGKLNRTKSSTARGFEPLRAEPNGFLVHHLNHSVTLSCPLRSVAGYAGGRQR